MGILIYESGIHVPPRVGEGGGGRRGLRERPLTKMEGFQSGPSLKDEGDFGTKNNK